MEYNMKFGTFVVSGTLLYNESYRDILEKPDSNGMMRRTVRIPLKTMDGQELLIKFSATENWKKPYEAVKEFYEVVKPNQSIICEGSIKYSDKTASFNLFKYELNIQNFVYNEFCQPLVVNKFVNNHLYAYIITNDRNKYFGCRYEIRATNQFPLLEYGDYIVAHGFYECDKEMQPFKITDIIPNTIYKKQFNKDFFKSDEINSIFNGSHPDLQKLINGGE